jgi:hypothetical protein
MKNNIVVKNNFLKKEELQSIKNLLLSDNFSWFYSNTQVKANKDCSFFFHSFFHNNRVNSNHLDALQPILNNLKPVALINIRANLMVKKPESNSSYHIDSPGAKTAIFYVNTNNGCTEFKKDKKKIKSVENRILIFPSGLTHRAIGQTDTDRRIVINFNYYDGPQK